jgi:hypothetical protein
MPTLTVEETMAEKKKRERLAKAGETWVAVRISEPMKERMEAWAERTGSSVSFIARRLVQEALDADRDKDGIP